MLSMYTSKDQRDWDMFVPLISFAYNTAIQSTTNYSPLHLVYGREPIYLSGTSFIETETHVIDNVDLYGNVMKSEFDKCGMLAKDCN